MHIETCMINFIPQCITSVRKPWRRDQTASKSLVEIVVLSVKTSKEFVSRFSAVSVQATNCQKPHTNSPYFHLLGCSTIHASHGKRTHVKVEHLRLNGMGKAYEKLFWGIWVGKWGLSCRILGGFHKFPGDLLLRRKRTVQQNKTEMRNHLFLFKEAFLAYKKFLKRESCKLDEASVSTLICLNAFIADPVDLLLQSIEKSRALLETSAHGIVSLDRMWQTEVGRKLIGQYSGGQIPHESARRLIDLLPVTSS